MFGGIRSRLTYANVVSTLCLFILLGGGAWAAAKINSGDVINDSLKSVDLKDGKGVKSADVIPGSLTGGAIDESTLQNVDAASVGGLQVRKINFQVPYGTGPTTVLDLAGLQIDAECQNFGDFLDVNVFTSKNGASAFYFAGFAGVANDTDADRDIDSISSPDRSFDIGDRLQIDNSTPLQDHGGIGTLNYSAPDGSAVVAHLALDEIVHPPDPAANDCALTGIAIGG